jgi:hypothetical protein
MVDVIGLLVAFVAVKEGIFPDPSCGRSLLMAGLLLCHTKLVAPLPPVIGIATVVPGHIVWLPGLVTVGDVGVEITATLSNLLNSSLAEVKHLHLDSKCIAR